jgi:hypothetical protein
MDTYVLNLLNEVIKSKIETLSTRLDGMDKAVEIKTIDMERRLEGLNELRNDVIKDRSLLVRQDTYKMKIRMIDDWITTANEKLTTLMISYNNRISLAHWLSIVAIILTAVNIIIFVILKK